MNPIEIYKNILIIVISFLIIGSNNSAAQLQVSDEVPSKENDQQQQIFTYSQETLSKLLPSLVIVPKFVELSLGDTIQFNCVTKDLDPDPDPDTIEWTFERIEDRVQLRRERPQIETDLPPNVTASGNILRIWSMTKEHCGIYKCTCNLPEFNITAQASAELVLKPNTESPPNVFVSPELIRLSPNSSGTVYCEVTGYPVPKIVWYKLENGDQSIRILGSNQERVESVSDLSPSMQIDKLKIENIPYSDAIIYCLDRQPPCKSSGSAKDERVTGISIFKIESSQIDHQGHYFCRAKNHLGSNQASTIVDVEIGEQPHVMIADDNKEQTIELSGANSSKSEVTFKCTVESGKPYPVVRWFRPSTYNTDRHKNIHNDNLVISRITTTTATSNEQFLYDLNTISSATSNVTTWTDDNGKSVYLSISTNSLNDQGQYVCLAENEWGRHSALAKLNIRKPVSIRIVQASPYVARTNDSFHLDCLATGYPLPLDIEWSRYERGTFFSLISRHPSSNLDESQERAVLKFDRISPDESGEYTCNARDPIDQSIILRDTIMVLVEDGSKQSDYFGKDRPVSSSSLLPRLMIRPTKIKATVGSNVTLDCLAVSGLQPTVVEWIGTLPSTSQESSSSRSMENNDTNNASVNFNSLSSQLIRPFYRAGNLNYPGPKMFQFGSKLRVVNISKSHEGVYQCRGRNKMGVEIAPALIRVVDREDIIGGEPGTILDSIRSTGLASEDVSQIDAQSSVTSNRVEPSRTKIAKTGSNIELKCQVHGVDQPVTSWSRDGQELPKSSVQIEHNLWIRNVSQEDNGIYICSAKSKIPNRVIQARINLLVQGDPESSHKNDFSAKIVASKSVINAGDSITLECIITANNSQSINSANHNHAIKAQSKNEDELSEIERNVVWTNLHSGQSVFQDNVYVQNNLLIIYELKPENSATYRCNYYDLSQHTDFKLHVPGSESFEDKPNLRHASNLLQTNSQILKVAQGSQIQLTCDMTDGTVLTSEYYWVRGATLEDSPENILSDANKALTIDNIQSDQADWYLCRDSTKILRQILVQVIIPVARFTQRPVSFISLPTISGADHQLSLELKFLAEREHGLILFNGQQSISEAGGHFSSSSNRSSAPLAARALNSSSSYSIGSATNGDYILLGLNRGFVEFRFELGDGVTLLRSQQPVSMNEWHRLVIERNRQEAIMWIDSQAPIRNTSSGKFFNLNLDSVLYVGGSQFFLHNKANLLMESSNGPAQSNQNDSRNKQTNNRKNLKQQRQSANQKQHQQQTNATTTTGSYNSNRFFGYSRGFEGCIAQLRISRNEVNLMARNRILSVGIYECDKPECLINAGGPVTSVGGVGGGGAYSSGSGSNNLSSFGNKQSSWCNSNGFCQVDRSWRVNKSMSALQFVSPDSDLRCICLPGFAGDRCNSLEQHDQSPGVGRQLQAGVSPGVGSGAGQAPGGDLLTSKPAGWTSSSSSSFASSSGGSSFERIADSDGGRRSGSSSSGADAGLDLSQAPSRNNKPTTTATKQDQMRLATMDGACERLNRPCETNGTLECESLTKSSFRCHCQLGFMGKTCSQAAQFGPSSHSGRVRAIHFNEQAYLRLRFNQVDEAQSFLDQLKRGPASAAAAAAAASEEAGANNNKTATLDSINASTNNNNSNNNKISAIESSQLVPTQTTRAESVINLTEVTTITMPTPAAILTNGEHQQGRDFNLTAFLQMSSVADRQNISFNLNTLSKYGLLFYTGHSSWLWPENHITNVSLAGGEQQQQQQQFSGGGVGGRRSKSLLANLLGRLAPRSNSDYLAIGLVDGHVELSYELGSGPAIIRSSERVNDGLWHEINITRDGIVGQLLIDGLHKSSGQSAGKLSVLNAQSSDFYLGGLPLPSSPYNWQQFPLAAPAGPNSIPSRATSDYQLQQSAASGGSASLVSSSNVYVTGFTGCISNLVINTLGPLDLIESNHMTQVVSARNLEPCKQLHQQQQHALTTGNSQVLPSAPKRRKPYVPKPESDDPDELR